MDIEKQQEEETKQHLIEAMQNMTPEELEAFLIIALYLDGYNL